ncbi:MAG: endonuclease III [Patescibacteria group bacterium]
MTENLSKNERALKAAQLLKKEHPNPVTELNHENELQLAVAVALSAQTTDKKVNEITSTLFKKYKTWEDFANADLQEITNDIKGVNFHKGKAERLIKMGQMMVTDFNGKLPRTIKELIKLPGVARKTANVILQEIWDIAEGIVVDTHVTRVSNRLGLTTETNAVKIENELIKLLPKEYWRNFSGSLVLHGRYVCKARKPECAKCMLNEICPSAFSFDA